MRYRCHHLQRLNANRPAGRQHAADQMWSVERTAYSYTVWAWVACIYALRPPEAYRHAARSTQHAAHSTQHTAAAFIAFAVKQNNVTGIRYPTPPEQLLKCESVGMTTKVRLVQFSVFSVHVTSSKTPKRTKVLEGPICLGFHLKPID